MKIAKDLEIEKATAGKEEVRYMLQHVYFTGKEAVATNGHILAVVPAEAEEGDTSGTIPPEVFKQARKVAKKFKSSELEMKVNGNVTFPDGSTMPRDLQDGQYPNYGLVLNSYDRTDALDRAVTFSLNVNLLLALADAISTNREIVFTVVPDKNGNVLGPITAVPREDQSGDIKGVIMPMRF